MITEQDLKAAIAECQGERNPNANTCIKLAAYYTIKEHLFPSAKDQTDRNNERFWPSQDHYSYASAPDQKPYEISLSSGTEFARVIEGRDPEEIMPLMDEAMTLLRSVYPACYNAIMKQLQQP